MYGVRTFASIAAAGAAHPFRLNLRLNPLAMAVHLSLGAMTAAAQILSQLISVMSPLTASLVLLELPMKAM